MARGIKIALAFAAPFIIWGAFSLLLFVASKLSGAEVVAFYCAIFGTTFAVMTALPVRR